jgi:hypothetical protein
MYALYVKLGIREARRVDLPTKRQRPASLCRSFPSKRMIRDIVTFNGVFQKSLPFSEAKKPSIPARPDLLSLA